MEVYKAIAAVMEAFSKEGISKSRTNTQGATYKFRGIDDVLNALSGHLSTHGLVIIPRVLSRECVERVTKNGGAIFYTNVDVEFDLISAADGSKHTARVQGEAMDTSDKSTNKAMSAAYKYMAFQTFCIPTEGDNDADAATHEVKPAAKNDAAREAFTRLQKDFRTIKDTDQLKLWWRDNADDIGSLPVDWGKNIRSEWIAHGVSLKQAQDTVSEIQEQFPGAKVVSDNFVENFINGGPLDGVGE